MILHKFEGKNEAAAAFGQPAGADFFLLKSTIWIFNSVKKQQKRGKKQQIRGKSVVFCL